MKVFEEFIRGLERLANISRDLSILIVITADHIDILHLTEFVLRLKGVIE